MVMRPSWARVIPRSRRLDDPNRQSSHSLHELFEESVDDNTRARFYASLKAASEGSASV